jgi:ribonuclease R
VQGIELPAEGLVHVTSLSDDFYRYDRASHTLSGYRSGNRYRLGDAVTVAVARVDVDRRELDFRVVGRGKSPSRTQRIGTKKQRKAEKNNRAKSSGKGRSSGKSSKRPRK